MELCSGDSSKLRIDPEAALSEVVIRRKSKGMNDLKTVLIEGMIRGYLYVESLLNAEYELNCALFRFTDVSCTKLKRR